MATSSACSGRSAQTNWLPCKKADARPGCFAEIKSRHAVDSARQPPLDDQKTGRQACPGIGSRLSRNAQKDPMKYALLIYAMPDPAEAGEPQPGEGVIDSWLDYTIALKQSGALIAAEQLNRPEPAPGVGLAE